MAIAWLEDRRDAARVQGVPVGMLDVHTGMHQKLCRAPARLDFDKLERQIRYI